MRPGVAARMDEVLSLVKRVLLIGSGSISRRHWASLREEFPKVAVVLLRRPGAPALDPLVASGVERVVESLDAAIVPRPDFAIIATPASTHLDFALPLAEAGIGMLIEKPLAIGLEGCGELESRCQRNGVAVVVGYTLRYHPGFRALQEQLACGTIGRPLMLRAEVGQYLSDWRPGTDYRRSVTAQRALGGGALLELSHELDLARALLGMPESVFAHLDRLGDLEIDTEDSAELVMVHPSEERRRVIASIHLDLLQRPANRRLIVRGTDGSLELDFIDGTLLRNRPDGGRENLLVGPPVTRNLLYRAEIIDLVKALDGARPRVGLRDGIQTQQVLEAARQSSAAGRVVAVGDAA